jgi:site-specific recombinase XerD
MEEGDRLQAIHPLGEVITLYSEYVDLSPNTIKGYVGILKKYESYLIENNIIKPRRKTIMNYRDSLWKDGRSNTTVQKYMVVIKQFYKWAKRHQAEFDLDSSYKIDISEGLKGASVEPYYKKEPLSIEQVHKLLDTTERSKVNILGYRNYALVLLMLVTGLRTVEITRAKIKDISHIDKQSILYIQGKGSREKSQFVKLPLEVTNAITDYLYYRLDKNPYLFVSHQKSVHPLTRDFVGKLIKKLLLLSGLDTKRITPHSLRHTTAYLNLKHGGSLAATRQLLRHKHIASTLIYADHLDRLANDSEERLEGLYFSKEENKNE